MKKLPQGGGVSAPISSAVLSNCSDLKLFAVLSDTTFTDNHVHTFVKVKLYHLGKEITYAKTGTKVKKNVSKLVLFNINR